MKKLLYTDSQEVRDAYNEDTYSCLGRIATGLLLLGAVVGIFLLLVK
jgi:hypothetical protein